MGEVGAAAGAGGAAEPMLRDARCWGRTSGSFTLQWHLTNACEAHCAHCYDRTDSQTLPAQVCRDILGDFHRFCRRHRVRGQVSLTGGNPLLHPNFWELYAAIADAGMAVSLLGNPLDDDTLARLAALRRPVYYQVSLEGLREVNDAIRGEGHFARTLAFLRAARRLGVVTHVMLTLHQANMDQVIPLGIHLEGLTRRFTFNRVAQVGEARRLTVPDTADYARFLREYLDAAARHPVLGFKDNLFNIIRRARNASLFGGCTGHGCGAAFNFVAVLPNGEVHACRKFPSPLGSLRESSLEAIYHSPQARRYRQGPLACRRCALRRHCRGCMAVTFGHGHDPLIDSDPCCFTPQEGRGGMMATVRRPARVAAGEGA